MDAKAQQESDISELLTFYDSTRKPTEQPQIGQLVFTPVTYLVHRPKIAEAQRVDSHSQLAQTEELVVSRAKKRPALVLAKTNGVDKNTLPAGVQRNKTGTAFEPLYLVAPIYSISTAAEPTAFGPVLSARTKCLMYPEFLYVPEATPNLEYPGILRLDHCFWSHLHACTMLKPLFVSASIMEVCWQQLRILAGEQASENYREIRELLMSTLPSELAPKQVASIPVSHK